MSLRKVRHALAASTAILAVSLAIGLSADQPTSSPGDRTPSRKVEMSVSENGYNLTAENALLEEILAEVSSVAGINLSIDPHLYRSDVRVAVNFKDKPIEEILETLTKSTALVYERVGDEYRLTSATVTSQADALPVQAAKAEEAELRSAEEDAYLEARGILTNTKKPIQRLLSKGSKALLLRNALIDTSTLPDRFSPVDVPPRFADPDPEYRMVQFDRPVTRADRDALEKAGAHISHYVPNFAYAVKLPVDRLDEVMAIDGVIHTEPYQPYYKMNKDILSVLTGTADEQAAANVEAGVFEVLMFAGADGKGALKGHPVEILGSKDSGGMDLVTVKASVDALEEIIMEPGVQWVEPRYERSCLNDTGQHTIRATKLKALHPTLDGSGVIIGVNDSGIDFTHQGFALDPDSATTTGSNSRIVYYEFEPSGTTDGIAGDNNGHGTHVSGTILGNGARSATADAVPGSDGPPYGAQQFAGSAPNAKLVMLEDFNSFSDEELAQKAYLKGARISNNSWGTSGSGGFDYSTYSREWDLNVRDADRDTAGNQEYIAFFSAGNSGGGEKDGTGGAAGTIGAPGNAKNVIAVGAVEQRRHAMNITGNVAIGGELFESDLRTDSDWQVAEFSSRGPVSGTDVRIKPDIVAPGAYVLSTQTKEVNWDEFLNDFNPWDYRFENVDTGTNYAFLSGTSMASPMAAGAGALFYQNYTNEFGVAPSPALTKAALVAGARLLNSLVYQYAELGLVGTVAQGWGMMDVTRSVDGPRIQSTDEIIYLDQSQTTPLETGDEFSMQVHLGSGEGGLKIVLAWTDPAGVPPTTAPQVNDLDLSALVPGGGAYIGNWFDFGGLESRLESQAFSELADGFNNVEVIYAPDAAPGTYTIRVSGYNVTSANAQDFALVIMKGIGLEGRSPGIHPALTFTTNDEPVIAYSFDPSQADAGQSNITRQILVRKWIGNAGDEEELGSWKRLTDQWFELRDSANPDFGISRTVENSVYPSIAVHNDDIFVAWQEDPRASDPSAVSKIFLRKWDGSDWNELDKSGRGDGLSNNTNRNAETPKVVVAASGLPIVAWRQEKLGGSQVNLAFWDGNSWEGLGNSHSNGIPGGSIVGNIAMAINPNDFLVVAWEELSLVPPKIRVRRWNGASWLDLGDLGNTPLATDPALAVDDKNNVYLAWKQTPSGVGTQLFSQIYASRYSNAVWSGIGGSSTYPGISGINDSGQSPDTPSIDVAFNGDVFVSWNGGGTNNPSGVVVREYNGQTWGNASGAGVLPGVADLNGLKRRPVMKVDSAGIPTVAFENNEADVNEVVTYQLVADRDPPIFEGLRTAIGGVSGDVKLSWEPATDLSSTIIYTIYRSSSAVPCGTTPNCNAADVFSNPVATVINATNATINGLTPNLVYCWGVRASDTNDFEEVNQVMLAAGPLNGNVDSDADCLVNLFELQAGTEGCLSDTDGDGMGDGWEWTFSTNNPSYPFSTNAATPPMDPLDNGVDKVRTFSLNDGDPVQLSYEDIDGDGASNLEEYQWWLDNQFTPFGCDPGSPNTRISPDPTVRDTDGDGMDDGYEIFNGLNPTTNDSLLDLDLDGVPNGAEFELGADPGNNDSDTDGLSDSNEFFNTGTSLVLADTDHDGLDDGLEIQLGTDPRDADSNDSLVSDGDALQLGFDDPNATTNFNVLICETYETDSATAASWIHYAVNPLIPFDFWHVTIAEPDAQDTFAGTGTVNRVFLLDDHSTNRSFRAARDLSGPPGTNLNANYSIGSALSMALESPPQNALAVSTLFLSYNEYFVTEPNKDFVEVQARSGFDPNWVVVQPPASGKSGVLDPNTNTPARWVHRVVSLNDFAGFSDVRVRFVFTALNSINNEFPGWWVDDVKIYEGTTISGWARDVNGRALEGVRVLAIGRGGVTNIIDGHRVVKPGKIFGEATTAEDGSYLIDGLPQGHYYVKASEPNHIDEFYDGPLFSPTYDFGNELNPGVPNRDQVSANGWVDLSAAGATAEVDFELSPGSGRSCLGVLSGTTNGVIAQPVFVNDVAARVWNGNTNPLAAAFVPYVTPTSAAVATTLHITNNYPDWEDGPFERPTLLCDLAPGLHRPVIGTNLVLYPLSELVVREGETTLINISTNQATGRLLVRTLDNSALNIELDGRDTGEQTPALFPTKAGLHRVRLLATDGTRIGGKSTTVPIGNKATVIFDTNDLYGVVGAVRIDAVDINGNVVTSAQVYIEGQLAVTTTPVTIENLRPGRHGIVVQKNGYKQSDNRTLTISSGVTNESTFVMYQSDEDYDGVGDATEILGFTNLFLYSRSSDPDADGLNNLFEFEQFRLFNVVLNPFNADTDGDLMSDGDEVGYDGISNLLALSVLETNALDGGATARSLFVGRFLDGTDHFGTNNVFAATECDRFEATAVLHDVPLPPTDTPVVSVFTNIPPNGKQLAITEGHNIGAEILADGIPDRVDTDGDGMYDGFEAMFGLQTIAQLDVVECARTDEDLDFDGLSNLEEFLGVDGVACNLGFLTDTIDNDGDGLTNEVDECYDFTDPTKSDTDGDGIPDGWEYFYGFDPKDPDDAFDDADGDGLINLSEYFAGTNPKLADTDADFLPDAEEVLIFGTDPLDQDTDDDGLIDGREVWDKDLDGTPDGGYFPNWAGGDLDNDGFIDGPTDWDTDGDGMPDGFEVIDAFGNVRDPALDPFDPTDGDDDPDGDGLTNLQEFLIRDSLFGNNLGGVLWDYSTDPFNPDSDGDGMPDGWEALKGLHPMDPIPTDATGVDFVTRFALLGPGGDIDGDGLGNIREYNIRFHLDPGADPYAIDSLSTDPYDADTDDDGLGDGQEDRTFLSNPILQDTDEDRLMDGIQVPEKWGEVESSLRLNDYAVVTPTGTLTWSDALLAAQVPHSVITGSSYSNNYGHLATFSDPDEFLTIVPGLPITQPIAAIGGQNFSGSPSNGWSWITDFDEFFIPLPIDRGPYPWNGLFNTLAYNWSGGDIATTFTNDLPNFLALNTAGELVAITNEAPIDEFVIEWDDVLEADTNHFDEAYNDMWQLVWPAIPDEDLPFWRKVDFPTNFMLPEARWGAAASYVPVFETKNPRDDNSGTILMDNRKFVVLGGRDGRHNFKDVWELTIHSGAWARSSAPLNDTLQSRPWPDGLSEFQAVNIFGYRDTKSTGCPCDDVPWNCEGTDFGEPKSRPWSDSRSFDWTYVYGGWDEQQVYYPGQFIRFYKSTDDKRPLTEDVVTDNAGIEAIEFVGTNTVGTNVFVDALTIGSGIEFEPIGQPQTFPGEGDDTINYTGFNGIHWSFPGFNDQCETLLDAAIIFDFHDFGAPPVDLDLSLFAEIGLNGESSDDYNEALPTDRSNPAFFRTSSTIPFTIPAGSTLFTVNVAQLVFELETNGWGKTTFGVVVDGTGAADVGLMEDNRTKFRVTYLPSYKSDPFWEGPGLAVAINTSFDTMPRKGIGLAYDYARERIIMFGGINGTEVFDEALEGEVSYNGTFSPITITWRAIQSDVRPPARWGHCMAYDAKNARVLMFGGFDANHEPLNDTWFLEEGDPILTTETNAETGVVTTNTQVVLQWREFAEYADNEIPPPRAGASMIYYGDYDYDRAIGEYCVGGNKQKMVMFGGTDGQVYFNDTWVFHDEQNRWIMISPNGEQSASPPPRAFASFVYAQNTRSIPDPAGDATWEQDTDPPSPCATPSGLLFGGRRGTIPTGSDTDDDFVDDGIEYELGGPAAGRDPRVNALIDTNRGEVIPFDFHRIGSVRRVSLGEGAIANFESLRHEDPDVPLAVLLDLPREGHPDEFTQVSFSPLLSIGVDAFLPENINLWWHQHGLEDPLDPLDVWQLGRPDNQVTGARGAPPYAYRGRWVYGTDLDGNYPNNAQMELYSPLFQLTVPQLLDNTGEGNNFGSFFLVFHEWLDLYDSNDVVRVELIRPETPADISNRKSGLNKPIKPVLQERNSAFNTTGAWRRIIAPLDIAANEENLYLRFTLQSDAQGVAGGWYIDDVAILQAGEITGILTNMDGVVANALLNLFGENVNGHVQANTISAADGGFGFGLLPYGNYILNGTPVSLSPGAPASDLGDINGDGLVIVNFTMMSPFTVYWPAIPEYIYRIEYTDDLNSGNWLSLAVVTADDFTESYMDDSAEPLRIYRIRQLFP